MGTLPYWDNISIYGSISYIIRYWAEHPNPLAPAGAICTSVSWTSGHEAEPHTHPSCHHMHPTNATSHAPTSWLSPPTWIQGPSVNSPARFKKCSHSGLVNTFSLHPKMIWWSWVHNGTSGERCRGGQQPQWPSEQASTVLRKLAVFQGGIWHSNWPSQLHIYLGTSSKDKWPRDCLSSHHYWVMWQMYACRHTGY